jgi:hypothetical protein
MQAPRMHILIQHFHQPVYAFPRVGCLPRGPRESALGTSQTLCTFITGVVVASVFSHELFVQQRAAVLHALHAEEFPFVLLNKCGKLSAV